MISDYLAEALLKEVLLNTAWTQPATVYMGLFTSPITAEDAPGGAPVEVSGGSYARQSIAFSAADDGIVLSSGTVTFPAPTGSWGTVVYFAILDAVSVGNFLFYGPMDPPRKVSSGDPPPSFPAGFVRVQLNGFNR